MKITFKYITLSLLAGASLLTSCEDFLDREPLDSVTPDTYLKNESQLAAYAINAYSFNIHSGYNGGPIVSDNGTDNQATASPNTTYWEPGQWRVGTYDAWGFGTIRNLNYFLEIVIPRWEAGEIEGVEKNIKQYIGETSEHGSISASYRILETSLSSLRYYLIRKKILSKQVSVARATKWHVSSLATWIRLPN